MQIEVYQGWCGGKNLGDIGAKVPNSLKRLLNKSPNINKLNLNIVKLYTKGDSTAVEITNDVAQIEKYASIAEKWGYRKAQASLMRQLKKIAEEKNEL